MAQVGCVENKASGDQGKSGSSTIEEKKYKILNDVILEMAEKDQRIQEVVSKARLEVGHPMLSSLAAKYGEDKARPNLDLPEMLKQLKQILRQRCICALDALILSEEVSSLSNLQISKQLSAETKTLSAELDEWRGKDAEIEVLCNKILKLHPQYLETVKKYYEEYKLSFRLPFDEVQVNLLCAKTQATVVKNRLNQSTETVNNYGTEAMIRQQKEKKRDLERENQALDVDLEAVKREALKFENLDQNLVEEFKRLQEQLKYKKWAAEQRDNMNGGSSLGDSDFALSP